MGAEWWLFRVKINKWIGYDILYAGTECWEGPSVWWVGTEWWLCSIVENVGGPGTLCGNLTKKRAKPVRTLPFMVQNDQSLPFSLVSSSINWSSKRAFSRSRLSMSFISRWTRILWIWYRFPALFFGDSVFFMAPPFVCCLTRWRPQLHTTVQTIGQIDKTEWSIYT